MKTVYRKFYLPEHPLGDMLGFVTQYKLVAQKMLGRLLQPGEMVHHKNFDKGNDSESNLQVMTRPEHQQIPELQAKFLISKGLLNEFFEWWQLHKVDGPSEESQIKQKLIKAQNEQEMIKRKLARCNHEIDPR